MGARAAALVSASAQILTIHRCLHTRVRARVRQVMRDGFGMLGSLVFAFCVGSRFDSSVKEWRLFADLINDVGLSLDMLAPMLPDRFVLITSCGAMCKTMCGVAAGATRASITAHFALRDNLADVSTKEGAQETAVSLLGLVVGVGLAQHTTLSHASARLLFGLLTALHIFANYRGVRSLCLCSLNAQRARLLIDAVADGGSADRVSIAQREAIFRWHSGPRIRLGTSVAAAFGGTLGGTAFAAAAEACAGERHVLWPSGRCVHVLLEDGCSQLDQLRAFTHARLLLRARGERGFSRWPDDQSGGEVCALSAEVASTRAELKGFFSRLLAAVDEHGWSVLCVHLDAGPYRYSREM